GLDAGLSLLLHRRRVRGRDHLHFAARPDARRAGRGVMMRRTLPLALLVVVVNAAMLASVRANRSGDAARIVMTERELALQVRSDRDSAVKLILRYEEPLDWWKGRDGEVLRAVGFTCTTPMRDTIPTPCGLARRVFAALEYDGPAWRAIAAQRMRQRDDLLAHDGKTNAQQIDYLGKSAKHGTHLVLI